MPQTITLTRRFGTKVELQVATEEELLAFANSIREAGGANALEALLPSTPGDSHACLIANALNFGCEVDANTSLDSFPSGAPQWVMYLPENLTLEQIDALAHVEGVILEYTSYSGAPYLKLPETIGNAAEAFDAGAAFQNLSKEDN